MMWNMVCHPRPLGTSSAPLLGRGPLKGPSERASV